MTSNPAPNLPLAAVELGDILILPDGRAMTTRCRVTLPYPVGSMAGFVIAGELEVLLATPSSAVEPIGVYVPVAHLPANVRHVRMVFEGAARYWAPHLPGLGGAMGEVLYRVYEVRGQVHPIVEIRRGDETVFFVRTGDIKTHDGSLRVGSGCDLRVMYLPRSNDNEVAVTRHSGTVDPAVAPVVPEPQTLPAAVPARKKRLVRR